MRDSYKRAVCLHAHISSSNKKQLSPRRLYPIRDPSDRTEKGRTSKRARGQWTTLTRQNLATHHSARVPAIRAITVGCGWSRAGRTPMTLFTALRGFTPISHLLQFLHNNCLFKVDPHVRGLAPKAVP